MEHISDYDLHLLDKELQTFGDSLKNYNSIPQPQENWGQTDCYGESHICGQFEPYDPDVEPLPAIEKAALFNTAQHAAFDHITQASSHTIGGLFFLNGPAGTGKTFCYNVLCHQLHGQRKIVLCVA